MFRHVFLTLSIAITLIVLVIAQTAFPDGTDPTIPDRGPPADHTTGATFTAAQISALNQLTNFVILVLSEDSFDNLMAAYPGADSISNLIANGLYIPQVDMWGNVYQTLPADSGDVLPSNLPNAPYDLVQSTNGAISLSTIINNPSHSFWQTQLKINNGAMNKFVAYGDTHGPLSMGYYNLSGTPNSGLFGLANNYTLFQGFHVSHFGDSVSAHLYLVGGKSVPFNASIPGQCPAVVAADPAQFTTTYYNTTVNQWIMNDTSQQAPLTRDCYLVGDLNAADLCSGTGLLLPPIPNSIINPQHFGDLCDKYNISWAYYAENFNQSEVADCTRPSGVARTFNVHEQPLAHFSTFSNNQSAYWAEHQPDGASFFPNLFAGTLENVTWYSPAQTHDYGVSNNSPAAGNVFVDQFIGNVTQSSLWQQGKLAVIVTFSSANGMFDHQAPYVGDRFGPGIRVPHIMVTPFHNVNQTGKFNNNPYETYSIFKMIARRFNIPNTDLIALWNMTRFMAAADLTASFPTGSTSFSSNSSSSSSSGSNAGSTGTNTSTGSNAALLTREEALSSIVIFNIVTLLVLILIV